MLCLNCSYNLEGISDDFCPGCGAATKPPFPKKFLAICGISIVFIIASVWAISALVSHINRPTIWFELAVQPQFDEVGAFRRGMATVRIGEYWGVIDTQGNIIVPIRYEQIAFTANYFDYFSNLPYDVILAAWREYRDYYWQWEFEVRVYDLEGNEADRAISERLLLRYDENFWVNELISMPEWIYGQWKVGLNDRQGNVITPPIFDTIVDIYRWSAIVELNGLRGFVNYSGIILEPVYENIQGFLNGKALLTHNGEHWVIDAYGNRIIQLFYDEIIWDAWQLHIPSTNIWENEEWFTLVRNNVLWGVIDTQGNEIIAPAFHGIRRVANDLFAVSIDNRWGLIDMQGNQLTPLIYSFVGWSWGISEGMIPVAMDGIAMQAGWLWGFINEQGVEIVPLIFADVRPFNNGLAAVRNHDKWGFIDIYGNIVVPLIYDEVETLTHGGTSGMTNWGEVWDNGFISVRVGRHWGIIDMQGNEVVPPQYDEVRRFYDGMAAVRQGDLWGFVNKQGAVVIPLQYNYVRQFNSGLAVVGMGIPWRVFHQVEFEGDLSIIDTHGNYVTINVGIDIDEIGDISENMIAIRSGSRWGFVRVVTR